MKVSATSNPNAVAVAFAAAVRESGRTEVRVVGAGAVNQAMKAVAIARNQVHALGIDLWCRPEFTEVDIGGQRRTALRLLIEPRPAGSSGEA